MTTEKWRNPTNLAEIEQALDTRELFTAMASGAWWELRRNGATKRWKRDPSRFRVPVKFGLRGYDAITEDYPLNMLRIADNRSEAEGRVSK